MKRQSHLPEFLTLHSIMKFEQLLMQREEGNQRRRLELEEQVVRLQEMIQDEEKLNGILRCSALQGSFVRHSCLSFPLTRQVLLEEIAEVENEIMYLERRVEEVKLILHHERKNEREFELQQNKKQKQHCGNLHQRHLLCGLGGGVIEPSTKSPDARNLHQSTERNTHLELTAEGKDEEAEKEGLCPKSDRIWGFKNDEICRLESPNKLSEQLIKILISIFQKLHVPQSHSEFECSTTPKLHISRMRAKTFMPKSLSTARIPFNSQRLQNHEGNGAAEDAGTYKNFIRITRSSIDLNRIALCFPAIARLGFLMHKLTDVELSFLSYKQKLAFWINIYNSSIMHAFLQHGLPTSPEEHLELLNKAAFNVGGLVLNAFAIEHFILRNSSPASEAEHGVPDESEALLRHAYGLGYPEPNVTFALCRGSCSSPALRMYTAENVVDELERAKVEFLEASVSVAGKKKIVIPKLLQWHMCDFADDLESLVEWIYSQLPRSGMLKKSMMEWLTADAKASMSKLVEIQPYEEEFCYLLPTK